MMVRKTFMVAVLAVGTLPGIVRAQAPAKCEIDDGKPGQVKDARNALVTAGLLGKPGRQEETDHEGDRPAHDATGQREPGWAQLAPWPRPCDTRRNADQPSVAPKASLGYTGLRRIRSTSCSPRTRRSMSSSRRCHSVKRRRSSTVASRTLPLVNQAVNLYNAKQADSAVALAQRALIIYPKSPVAYNVIGNARQAKDDIPGAVDAFQKMLVAIGTDTAYADEKKQVMLNIGQLLAAEAESSEGAKKQEYAKQAAVAYQAYLKEYPTTPARSPDSRALSFWRATVRAPTRFTPDMLAAPDKYSDMQLPEAGVNAARAERAKEASQLFEAGLKKNPYYRDGLFNLGVTYLGTNQLDKMPPILDKLTTVDPNNPENYRLWVNYYQDKVKAEKNPAAKKQLSDSVLKYFKMFSEPTVKVTFNLFSREAAKATLAGNIENLSAASNTYTLKVDFLDNTGNTVATQEATVGAVDPKASKPFRITVEKEGIAAFKYAPLDK
jgi:tetratricopeptide (TPR) repeat protein